jgi:DNA-binding CsgD family transcriptional regulator
LVPQLPTRGKETSKCDNGVAGAENLIRLLVEDIDKAAICARRVPQQCGEEEIILDTEVDGARYLLVRLPGAAQSSIKLSPREQEIVRMVAEGHPNKAIADVLSISSWTVCTHLRRIFAKLGVGSRAAMVARSLQAGRGPVRTPSDHNPPQALRITNLSRNPASAGARKNSVPL